MQSSTDAYLRLDHVRKSYDTGRDSRTLALNDINLSVAEGEFVAVVGPSGCGKSTLLLIVAGLISPSAGEVTFKERVVSGPPENMVYLFQQYSKSLFPWRTAIDNVAFALENHMPRAQARSQSAPYLEMVGLGEFAEHYPWQLSGGMQ